MAVEIVEVLDSDRLLRRAIFTDPRYVRDDFTLTSFAFKLRKDEKGISVDIERLTTLAVSIGDAMKYRIFSITAEQVRAYGLQCIHKPVEGNYSHAEITGDNISNSISSKLSKAAVYIAYP